MLSFWELSNWNSGDRNKTRIERRLSIFRCRWLLIEFSKDSKKSSRISKKKLIFRSKTVLGTKTGKNVDTLFPEFVKWHRFEMNWHYSADRNNSIWNLNFGQFQLSKSIFSAGLIFKKILSSRLHRCNPLSSSRSSSIRNIQFKMRGLRGLRYWAARCKAAR